MKLSSGLDCALSVLAVLLLSAPLVASAQSISPNASWSCTFPDAATDCGFYEQTAAPSRATIVSPGRDTTTAVELTTEPGDSNLFGSGTAERADLELPPSSNYCTQGQEEWWAHSLMFPSNYVIPPAGSVWNWGVVFDFHHTGSSGQPNFQIASIPTGLQLWVSGGPSIVNGPGDPGFYSVDIGTVQKNVWYDFMYHVKWSSGSDGYFQAWLNGKQVMNFSGPTLYTGQSCYLKLANYHTPLGVPISVIHSRIVEGATQADVQIPGSSDPGAATPAFSPLPGTYSAGQGVTLTDTTTEAAVHYTLDGTTPTASSTLYSGPIPLNATTTINAIAVASGFSNSAVASGAYSITGSSGGGSTVVSLSSVANVDGIANNGSAVPNGGLDGLGNAYSEALVGTHIAWNGNTYSLLNPAIADAVSGKTITLPAGNHTTISLLGTAVNGNQAGQTFIVKYTDGTSSTFTQSLSDWYRPQGYSGETKVQQMAYRVTATGALDNRTFYLYGYSFTLNSAKTVASITLPANRKVVIQAIDLH